MALSEEELQSADLVRRILSGDKEAEGEMVRMFGSGLQCILRTKVDSREQDIVDDVVQETWRLVLEKLRANELQSPHKLQAYIINTGRNQLIMHYRKKSNKYVDIDEEVEIEADENVEPAKILEKVKVKLQVNRLIDKMKKPRDREILRSYYLDEASKDAIRENQQLDELHFNRVLHRARGRFKALWQKESDE